MANIDLSTILKGETQKFQGENDKNEKFTQFKTEKDQNVYSPVDGEVTSIKNLKEGYVVKIKFESNKEQTEIKLQYLASIRVSSGSKVNKGDIIGTTAYNSFRLFIYKNGIIQNPDNWFKRKPEQLTSKSENDTEKNKDENKKTSSYSDSDNLDKEQRRKKLKDAFGIADIIGLPFSLIGKGIKSMEDDAKKAKEDIKKKEEERKKKEEDDDTDLSPDIQFEEYKRLVSENIERIKELLK